MACFLCCLLCASIPPFWRQRGCGFPRDDTLFSTHVTWICLASPWLPLARCLHHNCCCLPSFHSFLFPTLNNIIKNSTFRILCLETWKGRLSFVYILAYYPLLSNQTLSTPTFCIMEPVHWDCIRNKYRQLGCKSTVRVADDSVYRLDLRSSPATGFLT